VGKKIFAAKAAPSLLLIMGSIDWLTTIIGIAYFGAVESNPFIASLANTNLPAFTVLKLGTAVFVAFLFYQVEKTLGIEGDKKKNVSKGRVCLLRSLQMAAVVVLMAAAINNVMIIVSAMA
jgi:hypothetical protein